MARDGPGSAAYFAAYEVAKKGLTPKGKEPGDLDLGAIVVAGGLAGVAMWSIAIPPDVRSSPSSKTVKTDTPQVLKSRLQSAPHGTYSGFLDCARKTIASDGVGALWKGFGPAMSRVSPYTIIVDHELKSFLRHSLQMPLHLWASSFRERRWISYSERGCHAFSSANIYSYWTESSDFIQTVWNQSSTF